MLLANTLFAFDRQDSLRGGNGRGRNWWDVRHYALDIHIDTARQTVYGSTRITARITQTPADSLQLDLQELMFLDSVIYHGMSVPFAKEGNVFWVKHPFSTLRSGENIELTAYYHGKPRQAVRPPWDGGFIWTKDDAGKPWIAVACQGLGASVWWPCKDYQGDEPDSGMTIGIHPFLPAPMFPGGHPSGMLAVSNGRFLDRDTLTTEDPVTGNQQTAIVWDTDIWKISNPINTYNATFYIGDYVSWTDTMMGEKGKLDLSFYVLRQHEAQARKQFAVVKQMLHCFEYLFGPYPFYEDGYKLVEAPYLGMEHQSAVAYGNGYKMGYRGMDRSGSGVGMLFDYIIIHESGHEWFGNNITAKDQADNWIHEGFTTYSESLFAECAFGKDKARAFTIGEWKNIDNDVPVIGRYGVNDEGSGDKYDKGAALLHTIRRVMDNDEQFRKMLRQMNARFYHKTVTTGDIEQFISEYSGKDLAPVFEQYLRTTMIPTLEWYIRKKRLYYRFTDAVPGFTLPLRVYTRKREAKIRPTGEWQDIRWKRGFNMRFSDDFLIRIK